MKLLLLTATFLCFFSFSSTSVLGAAASPAPRELAAKYQPESNASGKALRKQQKREKRMDRFKQKLEKKWAKLQKKGRIDASFNLNVISLIVLALGGLFIFLGIVIPYIGILFIIIGALIAFVGLVMLLLLDGVRVNASDGSH